MATKEWKGAEHLREIWEVESVSGLVPNGSRMKREGSGETLSFPLWGPKRVWRT